MKSVLKKIARSMVVLPALVLGFTFATPLVASAQRCDSVTGGISAGANCARPSTAPSRLFGDDSIFKTITDILLFIIGAIAVIMLIIGGIRYVISQGDQAAVTNAKNTILYAIIGIIVAFLAFAAVDFVTDRLEKGTSSTSHSRLV